MSHGVLAVGSSDWLAGYRPERNMMNTNDSDTNKGLYQKFRVERTDGSSAPGGKHEHCRYFVLDIDHDPHAPAAIRAYADSCRADYPALAADLDTLFPNKSSSFGAAAP